MPVEFVYPSVTSIVPANIALVAGAKSPEAGKRFIEFTLSDEGQTLLLDKQISRLPVLPAIYAKAPAGYPNPFGGKIQAKVNFDSNLSESRYYVVVVAVRPADHLPPQGARGGDEGDPRRARSASARRTSPQLDEARRLVLTPAGRREAGRRHGAARRCSGGQEGRRRVEGRRRRSRRSGRRRPRPTTRGRVELASAREVTASATAARVRRRRRRRRAGCSRCRSRRSSSSSSSGPSRRCSTRRSPTARAASRSRTSRAFLSISLMRESFVNSLVVARADGRASRR